MFSLQHVEVLRHIRTDDNIATTDRQSLGGWACSSSVGTSVAYGWLSPDNVAQELEGVMMMVFARDCAAFYS